MKQISKLHARAEKLAGDSLYVLHKRRSDDPWAFENIRRAAHCAIEALELSGDWPKGWRGSKFNGQIALDKPKKRTKLIGQRGMR